MFSLFKINKNLVIYFVIFMIFIPLFGINFLISFLGNILLLIILIPILIFLIALISFKSFKAKLNTCEKCGSISLGQNKKCLNCGAEIKTDSLDTLKEAGETTIEIKAEEIK